MAGSFSDHWEDEIIDHLFMKGSYTMPTNLWVGLSTADPLDDNSGQAEPSGGAYARVSTSGSDWNVSSGGVTANAAVIEFPENTASWGTVTHFCIWDAVTAGNMVAHGDLDASRDLTSTGITPRFGVGELDVTLS
jgi:hypothetical protein